MKGNPPLARLLRGTTFSRQLNVWVAVATLLIRPDALQLDATEGREELLGFVQVMQGKETSIRTQRRVLDVNLSISLLFTLILLLALGRFARRLTQPIVTLSDSMARAGRGDLGVRAALAGSSQPSDNMQKHALTAIADIDNIVERVALTSRIEDRSLKPQQQICPLDEILAELLIQTAQAARVQLTLAADVDALRLCTDPLLLRTLMANLLDNALKYAPPAATVHVTVSEQARSGQPDPAQVFSKYYRAPLAHRQSGSGLGAIHRSHRHAHCPPRAAR